MNHEALSFFERAEVYRRAIAQGQILPTWWASIQNGYGSPMPLFYHRLFYWLAGVFAQVVSIKTAILSTVVCFLYLAAYGIARAIQIEEKRLPYVLSLSVLFLLSPYLWIDWVVRGAMAELSALALVPWLISELELCRRTQVVRWSRIVFILTVLFFAHSVISLFGFVLTFLYMISLIFCRRPIRHHFHWISILFGMGCVVQFIVARSLIPFFKISKLSGYPMRPQDNYANWVSYFLDSHYVWGESWQQMTVEIGRYAIIAIGLAFSIQLIVRKGRVQLPFLVLPLLFLLYLQFPISRSFYELFPYASFLQFPWRLLVFITPLCILILSRLCLRTGRASIDRTLLGLILAATTLSGASIWKGQEFRYDWYGARDIRLATNDLVGAWAGGEYLLKDMTLSDIPSRPAAVFEPPCPPGFHSEYWTETGGLHVTLQSYRACRITVRQLRSPMVALKTTNNASEVEDQNKWLMQLDVRPGVTDITIEPLSYWELAGHAVRGR